MPARTAKPKATGKGLNKKVMGMPLWLWGVGIVGGLLIGVYLRRRGAPAGAAASSTSADQPASDLGAGASPSDNGVGSTSVDLGALQDSIGQGFGAISSQIAELVQGIANGGYGGMTEYPPAGVDVGVPAGTDTSSSGGGGGTGLTLTAAAIKQAWADYYAAQRRMGLGTQTTNRPVTARGTTAPGGWAQISGPVRKIIAKWIPQHRLASGKIERGHYATASGKWVSSPYG